jgi:hypothetical protein
MNSLPQTGTSALLQLLSPHLDDVFVNDLFAVKRGRGRRQSLRPNQLFRVLLLSLLTPAHSFNLLVKLLGENRAWRDFCFLRNRQVVPDVRMLHEFRDRLGVAKLRAINNRLIAPFLQNWDHRRKSVAIIDSTDLPAATHSFKKKSGGLLGKRCRHWCSHGQERPKPMVHRL